MRRISIVAVLMLAFAGSAQAATISNPVHLWAQPMSCPDPDVFTYGPLYVAACTSDFGQYNPIPSQHRMGAVAAAFPMYTSTDLVHWKFANYIIAPGRSPAQAIPLIGNYPGGEYWAPDVHFIQGRWVVYFGAQVKGMTMRSGGRVFGLFVGWTNHLFGGDWNFRLLHAGGEFDHVRGNYQEGPYVIDPSVARDPVTGGLDIVWGPGRLRIGRLTPDGLHMLPYVRGTIVPNQPWEENFMEGPVLWTHDRISYLFYNAASTWNNSYAIGVATSKDPLTGPWVKQSRPVLHSGRSLVSTGIGAQPFMDHQHHWMLAFHVQIGQATHDMEGRWLAFARLGFAHGIPVVQGGIPHPVVRDLARTGN